MSNAFDDLPPGSNAPAVQAIAGSPQSNAFDDLTPPAKPKASSGGDESAQDPLTHTAAMLGRTAVHAVTALPMMAEDFGVGARNLYSGLTGGSYHQYDYPSDTVNQALDQYVGKPQNTAEKIEDVAAPAALSIGAGTAAAASQAPRLATVLGGALPKLGTTAAGAAGDIAPAIASAPTRAQMTAALLKKSQDAGYVVPPSQVNPTVTNKVVEGLAGKAATQQSASIQNQNVTNRLAAVANGLNPDAPLTSGSLAAVRREANDGYNAIEKIGTVPTDDQYLTKVANVQAPFIKMTQDFPGTAAHPIVKEADTLTQPSFAAGSALTKIQALRDSATAAYNAGDAQGGAAYKQLAQALEDQVDRVASAKAAAGDVPQNLVQNFRAARQTKAIAHTTQEALNDSSGNVSAPMLAKMLANGDPLSGDLRTIGEFGSNFGKAAQLPEKIGSPVSHVDAGLSAALALMGEHAASSGGHGTAGALTGLVAWPAARAGAKAYVLGPAQRGLANVGAPTVAGSPKSAQAIAQALMRSKPDSSDNRDLVPAY